MEADAALHFDPHSHTNPMPTNGPILPFLVLTMAGGCRVSNLMERAAKQQLSVCGGAGGESRDKCPC